ncbi:MAG: adenosylcobinamide-GDP ribazoletransferase, partial [Bacillota bacterium]
MLGWPGAVVFCVVGAYACLFCRRVSMKLGGLTGDVYGAVTELAQVVAMLVFYLASMWMWPLLL